MILHSFAMIDIYVIQDGGDVGNDYRLGDRRLYPRFMGREFFILLVNYHQYHWRTDRFISRL